MATMPDWSAASSVESIPHWTWCRLVRPFVDPMRRASRCKCSRSSAAGICSRRSWRQLSKQARRDEDQLRAKNQVGQPMGWTRRLRSENQLKFKQLLCFERSAQELDHGLTVSLRGGPLSVHRPVLPPSLCIVAGPQRLRLKCILILLVTAWGQLKSVHVQTRQQNKDSSR